MHTTLQYKFQTEVIYESCSALNRTLLRRNCACMAWARVYLSLRPRCIHTPSSSSLSANKVQKREITKSILNLDAAFRIEPEGGALCSRPCKQHHSWLQSSQTGVTRPYKHDNAHMPTASHLDSQQAELFKKSRSDSLWLQVASSRNLLPFL